MARSYHTKKKDVLVFISTKGTFYNFTSKLEGFFCKSALNVRKIPQESLNLEIPHAI